MRNSDFSINTRRLFCPFTAPKVLGYAARRTMMCSHPNRAHPVFLYCLIVKPVLTVQQITPFPILHINLLKPKGYVMHQQFNIQQLCVLPTLYLCVLYLSEKKQRLVPLTAWTDWFVFLFIQRQTAFGVTNFGNVFLLKLNVKTKLLRTYRVSQTRHAESSKMEYSRGSGKTISCKR